MALIKLRQANETGEEVGTIYVNTDQIVAITAGQNTTELQMADGRTRWVKESSEEVAAMAKTYANSILQPIPVNQTPT